MGGGLGEPTWHRGPGVQESLGGRGLAAEPYGERERVGVPTWRWTGAGNGGCTGPTTPGPEPSLGTCTAARVGCLEPT